MNKAELINSVAATAEVSKKEAEAGITATLDAITAALLLRGEKARRPHRPQPQDQGVH